MRLKVLIFVLITLFTLITVLVGVKQPALHKQTMISDEYHRFVEEDIPTSNISFSQVDRTPTLPIKVEQQKTTPKEQTPHKIKPVQKQIEKVIQIPAKQERQTTDKQPVKQQVQIVEPPIQTVTKQHELTEQEEIIAWNKWRSNLQNQVMKDAPICAPLGTIFKFSFTVDKYRNMSNIKVWSENPNYTDLAVRVIKPVLSSYNHKAILNFPQGTKRVITNVTGGYQISTRTKYSSPSDYSDYERVKRYY